MSHLQKHIWFVSELYYPDETSTGYLLTRIAEGLADQFRVRVVCGMPAQSNYLTSVPRTEIKGGVKIYRCVGTEFNRSILFLRFVNAITLSVSILLHVFRHVSKGDLVFSVTNPPVLPFLLRVACLSKRARFVLIVHDVYPEVLVAARMAKSTSWAVRLANFLSCLLYESCDAIITLGRDMAALVKAKQKSEQVANYIITNWADTDLVMPSQRASNRLLVEHGLARKFVAQYAGNMGLTHDLASVVDAAEILQKSESGIHFLLIGSGAKSEWLRRQCGEKNLSNVTLIGSQPRSAQGLFLNACDVAVITFVKGMCGVSVPSRLYNILASGKPIIAMADEGSELALVVKEEGIGWVVNPERPLELAQALAEASRSSELDGMALRARVAAEAKYQFEGVSAAYKRVVKELCADQLAM